MTSTATGPLVDALEELRARLEGTRLDLLVPGVEDALEIRSEMVGQVDDYLLPRLREIDAPLLAIVGGSTGAGKSTIVNSLVGSEVSAAGVLRPTTMAPVLVCHPSDVTWFEDDRVLPSLPRSTGRAAPARERSIHLVTDSDVPEGLALLDAPDIDSVVRSNRELAGQLLAAADLWLFVTTAARYADAVPWDLLRTARDRSTALAIVLNRVPPDALNEVRDHLVGMLIEAGLTQAPLFTLREGPLEEGLLPEPELAPLRVWIDELAADADRRAEVVRATLWGALASLDERSAALAAHSDAQKVAAEALRSEANLARERARHEIDEALAGGSMLRGEVLARWQEVVGAGELMRGIEAQIGRIRDRIRGVLRGEPGVGAEVRVALGDNVEAVVIAAADRAAEATTISWKATRPGAALLGDDRGWTRASPELRRSIGEEVRAWQGDVLELVRAEGASKRATGRVLSTGVNVAGAALMIAVFAHTGGLTGAEIAVAGGTATLSQKLLEALFGDQAVRDLTARAREQLGARIDRVLERDVQRFLHLVASPPAGSGDADSLRATAENLRSVRTVGR